MISLTTLTSPLLVKQQILTSIYRKKKKKARLENYDPTTETPGPSTSTDLQPSIDLLIISEAFDVVWSDSIGRTQIFTHSLQPTIKSDNISNMTGTSAKDFFYLFVGIDLIDLMMH